MKVHSGERFPNSDKEINTRQVVKVNAFNTNEAMLEVFLESSLCSAINYVIIGNTKVSIGEPTDTWVKRDPLTLLTEVERKHLHQFKTGSQGSFGCCSKGA